MIVWVTRDETADGPLSSTLRAQGFEVLLEPVIERRLVADPTTLLSDLGPDDWLVLTSPYAIEAMVGCRVGTAHLAPGMVGNAHPTASETDGRCDPVGAPTPIVLPAAKVPHVAVVGEPSRRLAERHGLRVALVAPDGHGQSLFAELRATVHSGIVCYPRSAQAEPPEPWPGVELRSPVLYETVPRAFDRAAVMKAAIAAVASPSAVDALGDFDIPLASIGRTTSEAIRRHGRAPAVEAAYPSFEHLAEAIAGWSTR